MERILEGSTVLLTCSAMALGLALPLSDRAQVAPEQPHSHNESLPGTPTTFVEFGASGGMANTAAQTVVVTTAVEWSFLSGPTRLADDLDFAQRMKRASGIVIEIRTESG